MATRTVNISARISPEAHAAAVERAAQERRPVASLLALILEDELMARKLAAPSKDKT